MCTCVPSLINLPPYLQGKNGDVDIENRLMDMGRGEEEEGGTNGESNMEAYTLPCVK